MSRPIDSVAQPATGVAAIRTPARDQRALLAHGDHATGGPGLKREPGWKVNVAGPFDPAAPRGTYLDILV